MYGVGCYQSEQNNNVYQFGFSVNAYFFYKMVFKKVGLQPCKRERGKMKMLFTFTFDVIKCLVVITFPVSLFVITI